MCYFSFCNQGWHSHFDVDIKDDIIQNGQGILIFNNGFWTRFHNDCATLLKNDFSRKKRSILNQIKVMVNAVSEFILNSSGIGLFMLISEDVPSLPIILPSNYGLYEPHYVITIIYDYVVLDWIQWNLKIFKNFHVNSFHQIGSFQKISQVHI